MYTLKGTMNIFFERCWSILAIVPQHSSCLSTNLNETLQLALNLLNESQIQGQCIPTASLKQ